MRLLGGKTVLTNSRFAGGYGVAVYASPPDASSPDRIRYRDTRLLTEGRRLMCTGWDFGADNVLRAAPALAVVKAPTQPVITLGEDYFGKDVWVQVRPHRDGIELPVLQGATLLAVDDEGAVTPTLAGRGVVWQILRLAGGGVRFAWDWFHEPGPQPAKFVLTCVDGPTSPADVEVTFRSNQRTFYAAVSGLEDGETYTFNVVAENVDGSITKLVPDLSGETDLMVVPDATGPGAPDVVAVIER